MNNTLVSVNSSDYGNPVLFMISAISGSAFLIVLCQTLSSVAAVQKVLCWFGRHSLLIMCSHALVLMFIAHGMVLINHFVGLEPVVIDYGKFIVCSLSMVPVCYLINKMNKKHKIKYN